MYIHTYIHTHLHTYIRIYRESWTPIWGSMEALPTPSLRRRTPVTISAWTRMRSRARWIAFRSFLCRLSLRQAPLTGSWALSRASTRKTSSRIRGALTSWRNCARTRSILSQSSAPATVTRSRSSRRKAASTCANSSSRSTSATIPQTWWRWQWLGGSRWIS